ncbi:YicC/YloC family endoribonuclease, partial [Mycobacterium tuberculosis]|uniref:YicC/YloC family endoribonuclease n=1 Tax=Mycobacterium tuberculosis TaxID=1773 RepID=UPI0027E1F58A
MRVNQAALAAVLAAFDDIAARVHAAPPTLDGILAIRGVLETADGEEDEATRAALDAALLADLDRALDALVAARAVEGEAIGRVLEG